MRDFRLSDDLHDPAFEFGGRAFGGVTQPVAVGVDRIYGDMQELGDFSEAGGPALIDNVLFEDCVVDNIHSSGTPIYTSQVNKGESCEMKNVVFRNVTILDGLGGQPSQVNVNNTYTSIDFDNLIYNSRKITSFGKEIVLKDASSEPWEHTWISFK